MAGFNFGQIGKRINAVMDTDRMNVGRRMTIINPDGSTGETGIEPPLYTNLPCHIDYNTADNPDPSRVDTQPIIVSITIHCDPVYDLQNGDFVTASKLDFNGEVMEVYTGTIGFPSVYQSRKTVQMAMRANM